MIHYRLACANAHEFGAWFKSSSTFEAQAARGEITCPACGSIEVCKAPMAPQVVTARSRSCTQTPEALAARHRANMVELMRTIRKELESRSEYVGPSFAEEARKIHFHEAAARSIFGEATEQEVSELGEDGIEVFPLPRLPEDLN